MINAFDGGVSLGTVLETVVEILAERELAQ